MNERPTPRRMATICVKSFRPLFFSGFSHFRFGLFVLLMDIIDHFEASHYSQGFCQSAAENMEVGQSFQHPHHARNLLLGLPFFAFVS